MIYSEIESFLLLILIGEEYFQKTQEQKVLEEKLKKQKENTDYLKFKQEQLKLSNSCKNFNINIKKKLINDNTTSKNKIMNNNILLTEYHISLIKKRIPFNKVQKNFKLNLIFHHCFDNDIC